MSEEQKQEAATHFHAWQEARTQQWNIQVRVDEARQTLARYEPLLVEAKVTEQICWSRVQKAFPPLEKPA